MAYAKAKYNFSKKKEEIGLFMKYDAKWVKFVVDLFRDNSVSKDLLKREYGKNLDGVGALHDLSYIERQRLHTVLKIMENRLTCIIILMNKGESDQSIKNKFNGKRDDAIEIMVANILRENGTSSLVMPIFKTKEEILSHYEIGEEVLKEAIELLENSTDCLLYKYTYEIGVNGMSKQEILDKFQLDEKQYQNKLLEMQNTLPNLIVSVKNNIEVVNPYEEPFIQNRPISQGEDKISNLRNSSPKKRKYISSLLEDNFKDNFKETIYTEFYFNQVLSYRKSVAPRTFSYLQMAYGQNLEEELYLGPLKQEEIKNVEKEIDTLENLLREKKELNGQYLPNTFLELFQTEENKENLTLEEVLEMKRPKDASIYSLLQTIYGVDFTETKKEVFLTIEDKISIRTFVKRMIKNIKKKELFPYADYFIDNLKRNDFSEELWKTCLMLQANKSKNTYKQLTEIYGEGLKEKAKKRKIAHTQDEQIRSFIASLEKLINKEEEVEKKQSYFIDNFIKKEMNEEERRQRIHQVMLTVALSRNTEGYKVSQLLFGECLNEPKKNDVLSQNQQVNYYDFVHEIKVRLVEDRKTIFDIFYKKEEQTQENIERLKRVLNQYKESHTEQYTLLMEIFNVDGHLILEHYDPKQRFVLKNFSEYFYQAQKECKYTPSTNKLKRPKRKNSLYFMDYFLEDETENRKQEEIVKKINYFITTYISATHAGYQVAKRLFGSDLRDFRNKVSLSEKENYQLSFFVSIIHDFVNRGIVKKRRPLRFTNIFITYDTPEKEKLWVEKEVISFLETIPKNRLYYQVGEKLYGKNLYEEYVAVKLTVSEKSQFTYLVTMVRKHLEQKRFQRKDVQSVDKQVEQTAIKISMIEKPVHEIDVVHLEEILQIEPFKTLMNSITETEQELIYLKLVQRRNPALTDEEISCIMNIPLEEIQAYEIRTKSDELNSLNQYIKRRREKEYL